MRMRRAFGLVVACGCLVFGAARSSRAQPGEASAAAQVDPAEVVEAYQSGFTALVEGDFDTAERGLALAAARSVEPDRRAAAAELLRLVRSLRARGARLSLAPIAGKGAPERTVAASADEDPDAGRTTVIAATTMASFYSGFVLLDLLDIDDFRPGVLVVTGATAAGFIGSLYGSRGRTITAGMGDAYAMGLALGVSNALLLGSPLGLTEDREEYLSFALGGLAAGGVAGVILGERARPTQAHVNLTGTMAMMGIATVGLGLGILQPDGLDEDDALLLMTGGLDVGAGAAMLITPRLDWSLSRARLTALGVFLGGLAGWAGAALVTGADNPDDDTARLWSAAALGGMWAGFGAAVHLTRNMQPDRRFRGRTRARPARDVMVTATLLGSAPGLLVGGAF